MKREQHIKHCIQILGEGFPQVHNYLDSFHDELGPKHREVLHNAEGVRLCIAAWGFKAGAAACLHIWADEVGLIQLDDGTFDPAPIIGSSEEAQRIDKAGVETLVRNKISEIKPSKIFGGFKKALRKAGYITKQQ